MARIVAQVNNATGNSREQKTTARPGPRPLQIDPEIAMNAVARLDDLVREAADLRRTIVAGFARYERPQAQRRGSA